jgi:predicted ABC-type ATPase
MLMRKPHLWIIAGPNGAGKTSLVRDGALGAALSSCEFINPDALTLDYLKEKGINTWAEAESKPDLLLSTFVRAAEDSQKLLERRIEEGGNVAVESVLSTKKYCALVERVHQLGGVFRLVYVMLHSPHLSRVRVDQRSLEGGHDVPSEKLESRSVLDPRQLGISHGWSWAAGFYWFPSSNPTPRSSGGSISPHRFGNPDTAFPAVSFWRLAYRAGRRKTDFSFLNARSRHQ